MDRDELINAMADAIFRLRSADPNVKSSDLARAALAVAEPVVFCSECHTSADSAAAWTAEKCEPPPELRGRDGWHWVQWRQGEKSRNSGAAAMMKAANGTPEPRH